MRQPASAEIPWYFGKMKITSALLILTCFATFDTVSFAQMNDKKTSPSWNRLFLVAAVFGALMLNLSWSTELNPCFPGMPEER